MPKWYKPLALALALPSSIIGTSILAFELVKKGFLTENVAWGLMIAVILSLISLMVTYAFRK